MPKNSIKTGGSQWGSNAWDGKSIRKLLILRSAKVYHTHSIAPFCTCVQLAQNPGGVA